MPHFSGPHVLTMGLTFLVSQSLISHSLSASEVLSPSNPVAAPAVTQTATTTTTVLSASATLTPGTLLSPDPRISHVLGLPSSFCGHVIDLLINNQIRQQTGQTGAGPVVTFPFFPGTEIRLGDVELLGVHLVADGNPSNGPVFQLTIRNNGTCAVDGIRLSLVGVLGQIHVHSPSTTVTMPRIEAGNTAAFQIQLPASAMVMSSGAQSTAPFETLVVAIDSFDEIPESSELNNVLILKRAEILPLASIVTATQTTVTPGPAAVGTAPGAAPGAVNVQPGAVPASPAQPAPAGPAAAPPEQSQAPGNGVAPDSNEKIDLDKLDLGTATESSLRFQ